MSHRGRGRTKTKDTLLFTNTSNKPSPLTQEPRSTAFKKSTKTLVENLHPNVVSGYGAGNVQLLPTVQKSNLRSFVKASRQEAMHQYQRIQQFQTQLQERGPAPSRFDCAYETEVMEYLLSAEVLQPAPNWTKLGISLNMRTVLIDWLIEVADEEKLQDQTLLLAIMYLDRCLSRPVPVLKETLQLLGVTCIFIASKQEEVSLPSLKYFAYLTDDTYTEKDILLQEYVVLQALEYKLNPPTILDFLPTVLASCNGLSHDKRIFAIYLTHMVASSPLTFSYLPSELATAIAMLSSYTFDIFWQNIASFTPGVTSKSNPDRLRSCIADVFSYCSSPPKSLVAAREKFSKPEFNNVAPRNLPPSLPLY